MRMFGHESDYLSSPISESGRLSRWQTLLLPSQGCQDGYSSTVSILPRLQPSRPIFVNTRINRRLKFNNKALLCVCTSQLTNSKVKGTRICFFFLHEGQRGDLSLPSVIPCAAQRFESIFKPHWMQKEPEWEFILRYFLSLTLKNLGHSSCHQHFGQSKWLPTIGAQMTLWIISHLLTCCQHSSAQAFFGFFIAGKVNKCER